MNKLSLLIVGLTALVCFNCFADIIVKRDGNLYLDSIRTYNTINGQNINVVISERLIIPKEINSKVASIESQINVLRNEISQINALEN